MCMCMIVLEGEILRIIVHCLFSMSLLHLFCLMFTLVVLFSFHGNKLLLDSRKIIFQDLVVGYMGVPKFSGNTVD